MTTRRVGDHTFEMIHMPGHTLYQAAVTIKEEGVVFTSDNILHGPSGASAVLGTRLPEDNR